MQEGAAGKFHRGTSLKDERRRKAQDARAECGGSSRPEAIPVHASKCLPADGMSAAIDIELRHVPLAALEIDYTNCRRAGGADVSSCYPRTVSAAWGRVVKKS